MRVPAIYKHAHGHRSPKYALPLFLGILILSAPSLGSADKLFLPNDFSGHGKTGLMMMDGTLSNADLVERAAEIQNQELSMTQRLLNNRWLSQHQQDDSVEGNKVLSRLLKRSFKTYWNRKRDTDFANKKYLPDADGNGRVSEMDYKVRLSSDTLTLGMTYEF